MKEDELKYTLRLLDNLTVELFEVSIFFFYKNRNEFFIYFYQILTILGSITISV